MPAQAVPHHADVALSQILRDLLAAPGERIAIGDLVDVFGPRAFAALLFVFGLVNMLPLPPGSSTVLSIPILIVAPQLIIGVSTLWLPAFLDRRSLRRADVARSLTKILPRLERVERLLSPRLGFVFGPVGDRLIGLTILALAVVLVLPIPFGNFLPAAAIAALSLGMTQRDGLVALLGYALTAVSTLVLILSAHAVVAAAVRLLRLVGLD